MIIQPEFDGGGIPLGEYPRPQFARDSYFPLNGRWEYAITSSKEEPERFEGEILVPYSPESPLSGVGRQLTADKFLHYRRTFSLPQGFNRGRVLLNIGACDQRCAVFCNGRKAGGHKGGYLPFTIELTSFLREGENALHIVVRDDASSCIYGRGKQSYKSGGIWYTAISGIWQSAWLESVPQNYLHGLKITPDYASKTVTFQCEVYGGGSVSYGIYEGQSLLCSAKDVPAGRAVVLDASMCRPWTPSSPELYKIVVTSGSDRVESYFGLRTFSRGECGGRQYFMLNGSPIYQSGLLDQGYWGRGIYTPESNRQMFDCLKKVKSLGFNMLRKHIKVEPLLWYYYCDVLGILVWQDMVNGGAPYKQWRINLGPFIDLRLNDSDYNGMGRAEARSRETFMREAFGTVEALYNCVSLCLWTPFNEGWGQFDAVKVWQKLRAADGTRLYDHASGWQDKGGGDVCSRHIYFKKVRLRNDGRRVLALTEFGGYSFTEGGVPRAFGYRRLRSRAKFAAALKVLYLKQVVPAILREGLCAAVYTQLCDVEQEVNGIFTADFRLKADEELFRELNAAQYAAFNKALEVAGEE